MGQRDPINTGIGLRSDKEAVATQREKEEDLHGAPTCPNFRIRPESSFCDIRVFGLNKFNIFFFFLNLNTPKKKFGIYLLYVCL